MHFCNWFLQTARHINQKLTFFTDEAWFHLSGYVNDQNNKYWSSINLIHTFEVPFHNHKICEWCAITATQIAEPIQTDKSQIVTCKLSRH